MGPLRPLSIVKTAPLSYQINMDNLLSFVNRQAQGDHCAPAQRALEVHGAVQCGHNGIHQRKADAAAPHRVAALVELGLDVFQIFRRDAPTLIQDLHKGLVFPCPQLDRDAPAGGRGT